MSGVRVEQIAGPVGVGEGPHWCPDTSSLLWVDIPGCDLHRLYTATGRHQVLHIEGCGSGNTVSLVVPVEGRGDLLVVGLGRSLALVRWREDHPDHHSTRAEVVLHTVDAHNQNNRFNDGKCDPQGRLWAGTMGHETVPGQPELQQGSLYTLDHSLALTPALDKINISNGLAWSHDQNTFYYIDSLTYCVEAFDFHHNTGTIDNRRTVIDYKANGLAKDIPDGMCIDNDGHLWVANFYGSKVICVDPIAGKILRTIPMPAQNVTSVCWGGPDYSTLYATSATSGLTHAQKQNQCEGGTFAITGLGAKGLPPTNFVVDKGLLEDRLGN